MTVHGCAVRSPLTGCQVTSRPRDRFSKIFKMAGYIPDSPSYVVRVSNRDVPRYYFLPVRPKYLSQRLIPKHPPKKPVIPFMSETRCIAMTAIHTRCYSDQSDVWDCSIAIEAARLPTLRRNILLPFRGAEDFPSSPIIQVIYLPDI